MKILVPLDGSECSFRALDHAIDMAKRSNGTLHVVHITDYEGDASEAIIDRAEEALAEAGVPDHPEVLTELRLSEPRYANRIGKTILEIAEEHDYDHVVMGHHGAGAVGRLLLGSAAETVVKTGTVPVTIIS